MKDTTKAIIFMGVIVSILAYCFSDEVHLPEMAQREIKNKPVITNVASESSYEPIDIQPAQSQSIHSWKSSEINLPVGIVISMDFDEENPKDNYITIKKSDGTGVIIRDIDIFLPNIDNLFLSLVS